MCFIVSFLSHITESRAFYYKQCLHFPSVAPQYNYTLLSLKPHLEGRMFIIPYYPRIRLKIQSPHPAPSIPYYPCQNPRPASSTLLPLRKTPLWPLPPYPFPRGGYVPLPLWGWGRIPYYDSDSRPIEASKPCVICQFKKNPESKIG